MVLAVNTARGAAPTALSVHYELQRVAQLADHDQPHRLLLLTAEAVVEGVAISLIRYLRALSADTAELEVDLARGGALVDHQHVYLRDALIIASGHTTRRLVYKVRVPDVTHMHVSLTTEPTAPDAVPIHTSLGKPDHPGTPVR